MRRHEIDVLMQLNAFRYQLHLLTVPNRNIAINAFTLKIKEKRLKIKMDKWTTQKNPKKTVSDSVTAAMQSTVGIIYGVLNVD